MIAIVTGSRWKKTKELREKASANALPALKKAIELSGWKIDAVIHGACTDSPDEAAASYAEGAEIEEFAVPAAWDDLEAPGAAIRTRADGKKYNARAGYDRNEAMAVQAVELSEQYGGACCIALHDGVSGGTEDMVERALKHNIPVFYCKVDIYNRTMDPIFLMPGQAKKPFAKYLDNKPKGQ